MLFPLLKSGCKGNDFLLNVQVNRMKKSRKMHINYVSVRLLYLFTAFFVMSGTYVWM